VDEMELRALRAEVALDKGVPAGHAKRLMGNSRQELEADATALLAELQSGGQPAGQQAPGFDQGRQGGTVPGHNGSAGHDEAVRRYGAAAGGQQSSAGLPTAAAPREVYGRG
jgi:hypothetical protein